MSAVPRTTADVSMRSTDNIPSYDARIILKSIHDLQSTPQSKRHFYQHSINPNHIFSSPNGRNLVGNRGCEATIIDCMGQPNCYSCVSELLERQVHFTGVTRETPCNSVLGYVKHVDLCPGLIEADTPSFDAFCDVFGACTDFNDNESENAMTSTDDMVEEDDRWNDEVPDGLDCDALTECEWTGIRKSYLGDGNCDHKIKGCYNSKICGYDGGDCCEDTCKSSKPNGEASGSKNQYNLCGHGMPYICVDPKSKYCDRELSEECPERETEKPEKVEEEIICENGLKSYQVTERGTWDGWGNTTIYISMISDTDGNEVEQGTIPSFTGKLKTGIEGVETACLADGCFEVRTSAAQWGNDVSWEVRSTNGAVLAYGGADLTCTFPIGGNMCENVCNGSLDLDSGRKKESEGDDSTFSQEEFDECMSTKCSVQLGVCASDVRHCSPCLNSNKMSYCYTNKNYDNVLTCGMCSCMTGNEEECKRRSESSKKIDPNSLPACTSTDTIDGSKALIEWSQCSGIDSVSALLNDWDENDFGGMDSFEDCAHNYNNEKDHGNKTALQCMQILQDTMNDYTEMDVTEAIIGRLYYDAADICDCSYSSYEKAPDCKNFSRLRTLLHETLDACNALDQIDCPAWEEYAAPCRKNMNEKFGTIDFTDKSQCSYIEGGCGGNIGPFPVFRRFDCGKEISKSAWDFHQDYGNKCAKKGNEGNTSGKNNKEPTDQTKKSRDDNAKGGGDYNIDDYTPAKPYVPPEERGKEGTSNSNNSGYSTDDINNQPYIPPEKRGEGSSKSGIQIAWKSFWGFVWRGLKLCFWIILVTGLFFGIKKMRQDEECGDSFFSYSHRARESTLLASICGCFETIKTKVTRRGPLGNQASTMYQNIPRNFMNTGDTGHPEAEMFMTTSMSGTNPSFQPPAVPGTF
uniref:LNR domain-containing protein n=1 Tax=Corethron hystrix TaxID=216773 RepID=A0A7S1FP35_9STRA